MPKRTSTGGQAAASVAPGTRVVVAVLVGVVFGALVNALALGVARVSGDSMAPTLESGATVILVRPPLLAFLGTLGAGSANIPHRDQIVSVRDPRVAAAPRSGARWWRPQPQLLKRVVAVAGDTLEYRAGARYVAGQPVPEVLPPSAANASFAVAPVAVTPGHVFVIGDNRLPLASLDSRNLGPVTLTGWKGVAVARLQVPFTAENGWRWPLALL